MRAASIDFRLYEPGEIVGRQDDLESALAFAEEIGYPVIIRPAFTLGGTGGGIAHDVEEMEEIGYEDCFYGEGLCLIEWANLIEEILPEHYRQVTIEKDLEKGFDYRRITIEERTTV